jgi:hypothetical protein
VEKNEVLLENLKVDIQSQDWTNDLETGCTVRSITADVHPEPGRTVQSVTKNFILTSRPIGLVSLF